jgi:hypothetical protein
MCFLFKALYFVMIFESTIIYYILLFHAAFYFPKFFSNFSKELIILGYFFLVSTLSDLGNHVVVLLKYMLQNIFYKCFQK